MSRTAFPLVMHQVPLPAVSEAPSTLKCTGPSCWPYTPPCRRRSPHPAEPVGASAAEASHRGLTIQAGWPSFGPQAFQEAAEPTKREARSTEEAEASTRANSKDTSSTEESFSDESDCEKVERVLDVEATPATPETVATTATPQTGSESVASAADKYASSASEASSAEADSPAQEILPGLVKLFEYMAHASKPSGKMSNFQSERVPNMNLASYVTRMQKYFKCSDECFVLCLVYVDRVTKSNSNIEVTDMTCHRLLLTSAMTAAKFHDDLYASNEYFAQVGGIATNELNALEAEFLQALDWRLYVGADEYNWFLRTLRQVTRQDDA